MNADYRSRLVRAMTQYLEQRPINSLIPVAIPVGPLADVAIDTLVGQGGLPRVPDYDPELFAQLRWYEPLDRAAVDQGAEFPTLSVDLVDGVPTVTAVGADGARVSVRAAELDKFALAVLAVVRQAEAEELPRRENSDTVPGDVSTSTPERGD